ncbi:MAG: flagellar hook-associated protein FlgK [Thermoleophilaceae bacterium]
MTVTSFMGLQTALRGLLAQQRALDVTSHNIANANTVGYSRQEALMGAADAFEIAGGAVAGGAGAQLGTGVEVTAYRRIRDNFLDLQYRAQAMRLGGYAAQSRSLDQVELALAEPGENGIAAQLQRFWSGWADLANAPESAATRQALVEHSRSLAQSFAGLDGQLATVSQQAADEYAAIVGAGGEVEMIANELGQLNAAIRAEITSGSQPNDLLDRRDLLLDRLSELGQVSTADPGDGTLTVSFGDAANPLVTAAAVDWPQTLTAPGGKLGALSALSAPGGTVTAYRTDLNAAVKSLADAVNAIHNPGGTGTDFFTYTAASEASTLAVNVTPANVRTSATASPGANDIALAIAGLRGGAPDQSYASLVSRIGNDVREALRQEDNAQRLLDAVADRRDSTAGVSLDEEMTNLIRFQRGYQASARAMSTLDEMLDVLINRTGRVGL